MSRRTLALFIALLGLVAIAASDEASIYRFELNRIDGKPEPLSAYRGKVLMLVNVASKCGYTPQYEGLEALYERYRDRGFFVLGFPANDFAGQEPGRNSEIAEFCRATWGVEFPMFEKISVRGEGQHPLYAFLTSRPAPIGGDIEWNFQKFLVDREGRVVERIAPGTKPLDPTVVGRIEALIAEPDA
ncbi:MAG: glutathione peroxidase [Deltaproteobacteria bacterium]|jgi:glutathione peroxidase|nr:glutathione peroxidase [Deltaproteobacteria bacterium]MBW2497673.1 glutathione peroxidase [Deltaproteobacteria bacterium]